MLSNGPLILKMRLVVLEWGTEYTLFSLSEEADAELLTKQFAAAGGTIKYSTSQECLNISRQLSLCMEELFSVRNYHAVYIFPRSTTLILCTLIDALVEAAPIYDQI